MALSGRVISTRGRRAARVQALDDGKVSAKTLTEKLVGQKRDILQRVEISRLSGQPVQDGDT